MEKLIKLAKKKRWRSFQPAFFLAGIEGRLDYAYFTSLRHLLEKQQVLFTADGILRADDRESAALHLIENYDPFQALIALHEYTFPRRQVMLKMLQQRCSIPLQEIIDRLLAEENLTQLRHVLSGRQLQKRIDKVLLV